MKKPPAYATKPGSVPGAVLTMLGGLAGIAFFIYRLFAALTTGVVPGKLGAMHHAPALGYYIGVAAYLIGIALGGALVRMSWGWLAHNKKLYGNESVQRNYSSESGF